VTHPRIFTEALHALIPAHGPDEPGCPPPPVWDPGPPKAVITRHGFLYAIDIQQGLTGLREPYWAVGRHHAEARARRLLAKWDRQRESWTVQL
jgi:hypothetical protein